MSRFLPITYTPYNQSSLAAVKNKPKRKVVKQVDKSQSTRIGGIRYRPGSLPSHLFNPSHGKKGGKASGQKNPTNPNRHYRRHQYTNQDK